MFDPRRAVRDAFPDGCPNRTEGREKMNRNVEGAAGKARSTRPRNKRAVREEAPPEEPTETGRAPTKRASSAEGGRRSRREHTGRASKGEDTDVFLDVPVVKVDEIDLEVEDLRASVSLQAEVLDLLKLKVGADVVLGRVGLTIKGVEAEATLKVQLDNVREIIARVLKTIDTNPQILEHVTQGLESTLDEVSSGAGEAVGSVGRGAGEAAEAVGRGAGSAVEDVGEGVEDVGEAAEGLVDDLDDEDEQ